MSLAASAAAGSTGRPAAGPASGPAGFALRALRAAVFAAVSLLLGLVAHLLAGGPVAAGWLLPAWGVAFGPAYLLAGRERTLPVIVATLAVAQVALHLLFSSAHAVEAAVAGHLHAGHAGHAAQAGLVPDAGMLVMHAWAVLLAATWLARGEAALWAVLRRLAVRLFAVVVAVIVPAVRPLIAAPVREPVAPRPVLLGHEMGRRGPPFGRAVTASA
ncbi:MFS transporter [Nonomuraea wenchangensis]|uniref:MFS transporter n=1 Tax=Nonomuraea wenchangensis TaxID=568860 RepID=UPI0033C7422E